MARDYARSSNIIYNPVEAEKKRHSSVRDYRQAVDASGSRDYRTASANAEQKKISDAKGQPTLPTLPTLGESVKTMNSMISPKEQAVKPKVSNTSKLGIVAPQNNAFKPQTKAQKKAVAKILSTAPTVRTFENVERDAEPFSDLRELPIVGPVYRGLDRLQEFTEPAAKIAQEFYTPGAGLVPIAGFTGAVGSTISKMAPKLGLGEGLGKTVAREAIKEGATGAVLGAGQSLAAHPEKGFKGAGESAVYGGVLGGVLGPVAPILGNAIKGAGKYVQNIARETTADNLAFQKAVHEIGESGAKAEIGKRNLADLDEQIQSLSSGNVANKAEQFNALANERNAVIDYIKQHEPDFEAPKPRVRASNQPETIAKSNEPVATTRDYHTATTQTNPPVTNAAQAPQQGQGIRSNYANQLDNGTPIPQSSQQGAQMRGFTETLLESDKPPVGFKEKLKSAYKQVSNQETLNIANKRINKDVEEATSYVLGNSRFTAEKATVAQRLIDHYNTQGHYQRAVDVAQKVSEEATRAGQSIQALSMFNRLTPEGVLIHAQRIAKKTNEAIPLGAKEVKVTAQMASDITGLAQATQKMTGVKDLSNDVMDILERAKAGEKLSETDTQMLKRFVNESKQFVEETRKSSKPPREPRQSKDKRVRDNVVSFLDAQEQSAKERLRAKGIRVSSTPLDIWADYAIIGASKMGKGAVKFADWSETMVKDLGEEIRPHLQNLYERSRDTYEKANNKVSKSYLERADKSFSNGPEDKTQIQEMTDQLANKVRSVIEQSKSGNVANQELQAIRDLSDELADLLPDNQLVTSPEKKYLQAVKSLSKKLAGVENERVPADESVKEVQKLLSTITKLADSGKVPAPKTPIDDAAIEGLGYQLMERTKPRVLSEQEKLAQRVIRKIGSELSTEQLDSIMALAQRVSTVAGEEKRLASQDLQAILQALEKPGFLKKVSAVQTIGQLLNPKTQVRNALGNELFYRLERVNKVLSTPIDIVRSKITGGDRTVTFRTNNQGEYWQNWMRGLKAGWKGVNVNGLETQYDIGGPAFTSKYNPLTYMQKALGAALKSFDTAAYMRAYNNTLGELATLRAINEGKSASKDLVGKYIREADDNMMKIADVYGKYVTFQDNNVISKGLVALKKGLNFKQDFGIGDLILKYPKTPGALLMRALEFSPAGFIRSAAILARPIFKMEPNTAEVTQALSRAIIGTAGLSGLGYFLLDKGVLTGAASKDRDIRDLQKAAGQGQYQVNLSALMRLVRSGFDQEAAKLRENDFLYTYDWMQPVSIAVSMGANVKKNNAEGVSKLSGLAGTAYNSLEGGLGTLTEQSVLSGLKRAAEGYPGQTITDKIMDILSDVPASFVPTAFNQAYQLMDNNKRETYSPNKLEQSLNRASAKTPWLAQKLPQQYDTLGEPKQAYQNNNWANVLLSPGFSSRYHLSPEAKFIVDLINESGDQTLAPRSPSKSITVDGQSIKLNGDMYSRYQQMLGEETRKKISKINPDLKLKNRVSKTEKALNDAGDKVRGTLKKELRGG